MMHPKLSATALAVLALASGAAGAQFAAADDLFLADASGPVRAYAFAYGPEMLQHADLARFMTMEMGDHGQVVKDAPYSAEAVTETTQVLGDGNRISKRTASLLYRDAAGRTRQEQTAPGSAVFINDPVSGKHTVLDVEKKTAAVMPRLALGRPPGLPDGLEVDKIRALEKSDRAITPGKGARVGHIVTRSADGETTEVIDEPGRHIVIRRRDASKGGDGDKTTGEERKEVRISVVRPAGGDEDPAIAGLPLDLDSIMAMRAGGRKGVTTSLGIRDIAGVKAEGTQTITTIPAGEIGNEKPIQIISEKWTSPDLRTVVYSRHSDPRRGETIYRLNNIRRVDQPLELFSVPAGYTIKEPSLAIAPRRPAPPPPPSAGMARPPAPPAPPK